MKGRVVIYLKKIEMNILVKDLHINPRAEVDIISQRFTIE